MSIKNDLILAYSSALHTSTVKEKQKKNITFIIKNCIIKWLCTRLGKAQSHPNHTLLKFGTMFFF